MQHYRECYPVLLSGSSRIFREKKKKTDTKQQNHFSNTIIVLNMSEENKVDNFLVDKSKTIFKLLALHRRWMHINLLEFVKLLDKKYCSIQWPIT